VRTVVLFVPSFTVTERLLAGMKVRVAVVVEALTVPCEFTAL
jgi:hypothetical protein